MRKTIGKRNLILTLWNATNADHFILILKLENAISLMNKGRMLVVLPKFRMPISAKIYWM